MTLQCLIDKTITESELASAYEFIFEKSDKTEAVGFSQKIRGQDTGQVERSTCRGSARESRMNTPGLHYRQSLHNILHRKRIQ